MIREVAYCVRRRDGAKVSFRCVHVDSRSPVKPWMNHILDGLAKYSADLMGTNTPCQRLLDLRLSGY